MLLKLNKIKNLGVFADYDWDTALPEFGRYNVIYGDNGTGKTTLSRLFECLLSGAHEEYPSLEYRINSATGELRHGAPSGKSIRVFNADYVQQNIGQLDGSLKPILVVGEENKAIAETLAKDQGQLKSRQDSIAAADARIVDLATQRGKVFTAIAKTISEATSGTTARTYRKNNAEAAFENLEADLTLSEEQVEVHRGTLRQEAMEILQLPLALQLDDTTQQHAITVTLKAALEEAKILCGRSAVSEAIQHLRENPDIAQWVESGHQLHKAHKSENCEYCGQSIPKDRWVQLEAHFNKDDQALKMELEQCIERVSSIDRELAGLRYPDKLALYSELRGQYDEAVSSLDSVLLTTKEALSVAWATLTKKLTARNEPISFEAAINVEQLDNSIVTLRSAIDEHNAKTASFDAAKATARDEIERHYLTSIRSDISDFDSKIAAQKQIIAEMQNGSVAAGTQPLDELQQSINERQAKISDAHKAGEDLTKLLHTFLGRSEIIFQSGSDGYRVYRNGKPARRLSEGERTAIAFIYFIVQLSDRDFTASNGIVVIDDPISSLDSGSIFQAFAFLKNSVKDAKQVFILTHNFGFLRLVLNWLKHLPLPKAEKKQFYMLICRGEADGRFASIMTLDKTLIDNPSEYHFLFKILTNFQSDGTIASCYHVPNITRKVLETFIDFYAPSNKKLYSKLADLPFDENKKAAIYKFSNEMSHFTGQGFEPGLVQESQKNTAYLLEMIKELAPQHYNGMMATIGRE